jgi:biotin carboxyl carrier protein
MQYEVEVGGRMRRVAVDRLGAAFAVTVDGRIWHVDAARIDAYTLSLILDRVWLEDIAGPQAPASPVGSARPTGLAGPHAPASGRRAGQVRSGYEVTIAPDRANAGLTVGVGSTPVAATLNVRSRRRDEAGRVGSGPQRITAPMPGKVVRVLVKAGDAVKARQPLVVVEAMKMENELRAGRDATVAEVHAREGLSVDAGALLVVIQ